MEKRIEFLKSEYSALRQEILDTLQEVPKNERLALVLSGVFWSWFVIKAEDFHYLYYISWLPFVLIVLLNFRASSLDDKFNAFHKYLMKLENEFDLGELGWEHFLEAEGKDWFKGSSRPFWYFLMAGNFLAAIVFVVIYVCGI